MGDNKRKPKQQANINQEVRLATQNESYNTQNPKKNYSRTAAHSSSDCE